MRVRAAFGGRIGVGVAVGVGSGVGVLVAVEVDVGRGVRVAVGEALSPVMRSRTSAGRAHHQPQGGHGCDKGGDDGPHAATMPAAQRA